MLTLVSAAVAALLTPVLAQSSIPISGGLQQILSGGNASIYQYPTRLTGDIVPKPLHSHNDYWREVPFYSALSVGAVSVEADVFLVNNTLYIGHEVSALTTQRTFDALYIQPILRTIQAQNPTTPFVSGNATRNGVYDTASTQTLYLWVDLKTAGNTTWPAVVKALEPLRSRNLLTTFNGTAVIPGPVTVIGTGNTPLNLVQGVSPRDYFWDAPIPTLNSTFSNITATVSPIASVSFLSQFGQVVNKTLNSVQLGLLRSQVAVATSKGIGTRYWELPGFPIATRNSVWRQLADEGVSLINVDDVDAASNFWQGDNF